MKHLSLSLSRVISIYLQLQHLLDIPFVIRGGETMFLVSSRYAAALMLSLDIYTSPSITVSSVFFFLLWTSF